MVEALDYKEGDLGQRHPPVEGLSSSACLPPGPPMISHKCGPPRLLLEIYDTVQKKGQD